MCTLMVNTEPTKNPTGFVPSAQDNWLDEGDSPMTFDAQLGDNLRHAWAYRHKINTVAYAISHHARDRTLITKDEASDPHWCLAWVRKVLDDATVGRLAPPPEEESEEEELLRYKSYDTYSDGTPVVTVEPEPDSEADPLPADYLDGSIEEQGPVPPGWHVVIANPPHRPAE